MARSAVILRISMAKPTAVAGTNDLPPIMKNERLNAQRDFLKRKRPQPEHKAPKRYVEVATNSLHRKQADYIPVSRGSQYAPPQRTPRVDEVESRGWGRRAPQSPSSSSFGAPQGNNEIYTYDVVFSPGEARKKVKETTQLPFSKQKKHDGFGTKPSCFFGGPSGTRPQDRPVMSREL